MMRKIVGITWLLLLTGCVNQFELNNEANAIIYPELQRFNIEFKNNNEAAGQQQISDIITDFLPVDTDTHWAFSYRYKRDESIVKQAVRQLKIAGVIPSQITQQLIPSLNSDIVLEVKQYHLMTTTCPRYSVENSAQGRGCFVNTLRMQQVVSPSTLIHTVKE